MIGRRTGDRNVFVREERSSEIDFRKNILDTLSALRNDDSSLLFEFKADNLRRSNFGYSRFKYPWEKLFDERHVFGT